MRSGLVIGSLALAVLSACGRDAIEQARVSFELHRDDCAASPECPFEPLEALGVVALTDRAEDKLVYAERRTREGTLAMLEIRVERRKATIRYREVADGRIVFNGRIVEQTFTTRSGDSLDGAMFSFRASQELDGVEQTRWITGGRIETSPDRSASAPPTLFEPSPNVVVIVDHDSPPPRHYDYEDSGCEGDTADDVPEAGTSCEGDTAASDGGGCDDGGGQSCEGDVAHAKRGKKSPLASLARLFWPIGVVGLVNRLARWRVSSRRARS
jgi:hypothetical protein